MAHEVFISYSSKDKQMADAVCHYLEQEKIRCWIAPRDVKPGANFAGEIVEAIPQSKVMLVILSKSSNSSKQVLRELEIAVNNDLIVIPLRIEDIIPTGSMSYYLSTTQWIDIVDEKIDDRLSVLSKRIRNILADLENTEEARQKKLELIEKERIEREKLVKAQAEAEAAKKLLEQQEKEKLEQEQLESKKKQRLEHERKAKEIAEAKTAEKLLKLQEKEKLELQQLESKEKQRIQRENHAKARAEKKIADQMHKLNEKEKLLQKQKELSENERQLKQEKIEKRKKVITGKKKLSKRKLIPIICAAVLVVAVGLTLFLMRETVFGMGDKSMVVNSEATQTISSEAMPIPKATAIPTLEATATSAPLPIYKPEDLGYDPNMVVEIPDGTLKAAIIATLEKIDKPVNDQITVADMFNLKILWMAAPEVDTQNILGFMAFEDKYEGESLIFKLTDNIDNLEGIQYAHNLNELVIAGNSLNDISHLSGLENLEVLSLIGLDVQHQISSLEDISGLKNLRVFEIDTPLDINALGNLTNLTHLHIPWCQLEDVSALAQLSNMEFLAINGNRMKDLSSLKGSNVIKNCTEIVLGEDIMEDISVLSEAQNLKILSLVGDSFSDLSVLASLYGLKELTIHPNTYNNNLETIDKLKANGCSVNVNTEEQ